jgi:uncharacterized protein with ParB-like and HNH nuclease domain
MPFGAASRSLQCRLRLSGFGGTSAAMRFAEGDAPFLSLARHALRSFSARCGAQFFVKNDISFDFPTKNKIMKANETKVEGFFSTNRVQFVIPVYQRNYDWANSQCRQLLADIIEVGTKTSEERSVHFIGSVVFVHDDLYASSKVNELIIIDGQQRLTTLTLLYLALYRFAVDMKNEEKASEIMETYLINRFAAEDEKIKLRPTENNKQAIQFLFRAAKNETFEGYSKIVDNFDYFRGQINSNNFELIFKGLAKLMFVEISLDRQKDDPQRIFESLNSTGLELSQSDLIRNYILMGLDRVSQDKIYINYWAIIENFAKDDSTNTSKVSDFIRDYLTLINNNIPNKSKVYLEFKIKFPTTTLTNLEQTLEKIRALASFYNKLLNPTKELDKDIRVQLQYIQHLEINVAYPFLMKVYKDYSLKIIDKVTFIKLLEFIQTFTWRRFIMGLPTNALSKIFMTLYDKIDHKNYLYSLQKWLLERPGTQRFPKNAELIEMLKLKDIYNIKSKNRTYLFDRLENFENKEIVMIDTDITIEHIFPQQPELEWSMKLGKQDFDTMKEKYLHTLGNLTLSGSNAKLGNRIFSFKRDLEKYGYKASRLWLNKSLASNDKWGPTEVEKRSVQLIDRFLKVWPYPAIALDSSDTNEEVNIFEADEPIHKKLEYAIFFNQKLAITNVTKLYTEVFKQLFELAPEIFFTSDLGDKIGLTNKPKEGAPRQAVRISENYFMESNIDSNTKFEKIKHALTIFEAEDELSIKYATENEVADI